MTSAAVVGILLAGLLAGQAVTPAERQRFEEIRARHDRGEAVSPKDRQFAQGVMARMQQANSSQAERNAEYARTHPARESTGLVPLPELGTRRYQGEQGGLYPGGKNTPPAAHLAAGMAAARDIVPRDANGAPAGDGRIVLLTIGMSNTTQETQAFLKLAAADRGLNPKLTLMDGAQGGQTAHITANPQAGYWKVAEERLAAAGVTAKLGPGGVAEAGERGADRGISGRGEETGGRPGGDPAQPSRALPESEGGLPFEPDLRRLCIHAAQSGAARV